MTNPFIEGFLKIEEARKRSENVFNEAKKLSAAQKRELDKNNNNEIDPEDLEMLRNEKSEINERQNVMTRLLGAGDYPATTSRLTSTLRAAPTSSPLPTPRPTTTTPSSSSIVPVTTGQGGRYGPRVDTTTEAGVTRASRGRLPGIQDSEGRSVGVTPTPRTDTETTTTPQLTDTQRAAASMYGRSQDTQSGGGTFSADSRDVAGPTPRSEPETPTATNTNNNLPPGHSDSTGANFDAPQSYPDGPGGPLDGSASASTSRVTTSPSRPENDSGAPRRYNASRIAPGMRMGSADRDEIMAAQRALGITADGIAGPQTAAAIRDFQRSQGLQADGIFGDQTRMAMRQFISGQQRDAANEPNMMTNSFSPSELDHIASILEAELTAEGLTIITKNPGLVTPHSGANSVSQGSTNSQNSQDRRGRERRNSQVSRESRER